MVESKLRHSTREMREASRAYWENAAEQIELRLQETQLWIKERPEAARFLVNCLRDDQTRLRDAWDMIHFQSMHLGLS